MYGVLAGQLHNVSSMGSGFDTLVNANHTLLS